MRSQLTSMIDEKSSALLDYCEVGFGVRVVDGQQPQPEGAQDIFGFLLHDQGGLELGDEFVDSGGLGEHAEVVVDVGEVNSNLPGR
jgi:hypothetical protein